MLGFDVEVLDENGNPLLSSRQVINTLSESMLRRMESIVDLTPPRGEAEPYPLYVAGDEVGTLMVKRLRHVGFLREKEEIFKSRGRDFLLISFLIAGGGALFLSMVFSLFLSRPVRRLKAAAEAVASGDLSVRVGPGAGDELGKLNRAFDRMVESLEREEALRRHLTSNVAHELRTPLAIMKANLEAVADGVVEPNHETMDSLSTEVERLINLVKGIEDFTTAEASFFKPAQNEEAELRSFVGDIVQGFRALYDEKGLSLTVTGGEGISVVIDTEKLDIVLRNLLSNAFRHTERGGVSVSLGEIGPDHFFVEVSGKYLQTILQRREFLWRRIGAGHFPGACGYHGWKDLRQERARPGHYIPGRPPVASRLEFLVQYPLHQLPYLFACPSEFVHDMLFGSDGTHGVLDGRMQAEHRGRGDRARFGGIVADGYYEVHGVQERGVHFFRALAGDVYARFFHHRDGPRMHPCGHDPGTEGLYPAFAQLPQEPFGHL